MGRQIYVGTLGKSFISIMAAMIGIFVGLGLYTFAYAQGTSYLSDDPNACINCHIMRDQFEGWNHSSHKAVATCNDCHVPHDFVNKWWVKGLNGWNHSRAFTLGNFPEPIQITEFNAGVLQTNCIECHQELIGSTTLDDSHDGRACVNCHRNVGHNR